ncbi:MAG: hypothetical protein F6K39_28130 [Okeania sp. SIO3B3]|nr:hypothetical protein [Okeania sp. SIO3B3]
MEILKKRSPNAILGTIQQPSTTKVVTPNERSPLQNQPRLRSDRYFTF